MHLTGPWMPSFMLGSSFLWAAKSPKGPSCPKEKIHSPVVASQSLGRRIWFCISMNSVCVCVCVCVCLCVRVGRWVGVWFILQWAQPKEGPPAGSQYIDVLSAARQSSFGVFWPRQNSFLFGMMNENFLYVDSAASGIVFGDYRSTTGSLSRLIGSCNPSFPFCIRLKNCLFLPFWENRGDFLSGGSGRSSSI